MITVKKSRLIRWIFFIVALVAASIMLRRFIYLEPPFIIAGDRDLLSKVHVNILMERYESPSTFFTVFLNGKGYAANDSDVDRFEFYI